LITIFGRMLLFTVWSLLGLNKSTYKISQKYIEIYLAERMLLDFMNFHGAKRPIRIQRRLAQRGTTRWTHGGWSDKGKPWSLMSEA
jgi:hypothetical protein